MVTVEGLPKMPELTAEQAELWIVAALAEARALRQHDDQLFPATADPGEMGPAKGLHAAWARWADNAEALYNQVRLMIRDGRGRPDGLIDLQDAIGRIRAMLQITPESNLEGLAEIRRGDVIPVEEIRRELLARLQQRRAAGV